MLVNKELNFTVLILFNDSYNFEVLKINMENSIWSYTDKF